MKAPLFKLIGFALTVLGAKLWLIGTYGVTVPLWDAWRQEGMEIYKPWLEGRFTPGMLFINNNVHHIACTRLADLTLFILNADRWDVRTEMVANALLHVLGSTVILTIIYRHIGRLSGNLALGAMGWCLVVPLAYENTLWGYQSQFYFLIFFSVLTLWGLLGDEESTGPGRRLRARSWCGRIAAFLACFTMGSGFVAAGISFSLLAGRAGWRGRWRQALPNLLTSAAATLLGVGLFAGAMQQVQGSAHPHKLDHLTNHSGWLPNVLAVTGWPIGGGTKPWGGLLLYAPFGLWLWRQWRNRPRWNVPAGRTPATPAPRAGVDTWFFAGFGLWALAQGVSIGMLRGVPPGSRHLDALLYGVVVNLLALGILWRKTLAVNGTHAFRQKPVLAFAAAALLWLILTGAGLLGDSQRVWHRALPEWKAQMPAYQQAVEQFAATDDPAYLQARPVPFFDQPKWPRLANMLRDDSLRAALSTTLKFPDSTRAAEPVALPERVLTALIPAALPCVILGGLLVVVGFGIRFVEKEHSFNPE